LAAWEQFKSFGMYGLAHVGYLLSHAAKAGEPKLASIFLRIQCLSDTHADTGLGQVDLVDRKTKPLL
jgi:hypothetical protein